ncbi:MULTISPECIES: hypothetical protein [Halomonadaceae]|uniref:hypothetical protein n=1 Tax=Halomonadaceae TaxID=28256 RepID=UPI0015999E56|nr:MULTISPECIES: hypothetical protein [Halomonas]QJQ96296.1 hypothetical protein HIO72_14155 [Halomonas sp. PA5]
MRHPLSARRAALVSLLATLLLGGCTVNTYPDGSRETIWGAPLENDERAQHRPGTYRDETGETRGQTQVPER